MKNETKADRFARQLANFTGFIGSLMREPIKEEHTQAKPRVLRWGLDDTIITVEMWWGRGEGLVDPVWDQTCVNGTWTGNRCGGAEAVSELAAAYFAKEFGLGAFSTTRKS